MGSHFVLLMRRIRVLTQDVARDAKALETAFRQSRPRARIAIGSLRIKLRGLGGLIARWP